MRRHLEPLVWLLVVGLIGYVASASTNFENKTTHGGNNRPRVFSPRMDYDEWTPLGRGNPLRNDPTYDYVPPVLDRVQYWLDTQTTEPTSKRDILLLGATAKKTSAKIPEQYLKFATRPKFTNNQENQVAYKKNFTTNPSLEPAKLRTTGFRNDVIDYRNQNRMPSVSGGYYSNSYYGQQSKPYTMMLPPPLVPNSHHAYDHSSNDKGYEDSYQFSTQTESGPLLQSDQQLYDYPSQTYSQSHLQQQFPRIHHGQTSPRPTAKGTLVSHIETLKSYSPTPGGHNQNHESTTSSVSFEKSDLIYQSSQTLAGGWLVNDRSPSIKAVSNNQEHYYQDIDHQAAGSSNHEVVIGQNANIIVQGESCANDEVVIGQKEEAPSVPKSDGVITGSMENADDAESIGEHGSASNMHIVLANTPLAETTDAAVAVVMPTNYVEKKKEVVHHHHAEAETTKATRNGSVEAVALETDESAQVEKNFRNVTGSPKVSFHTEDPPTQAPMRNPMPYHQSPTRFPPPRIFSGSPIHHMVHQPGVQGRPVQNMMHYGSNLHIGMGMGLRPPAPPAMANGQVSMGALHQRHQLNAMMNMDEQNQARWPYRHQLHQSPETTMTSVVPSQTVTPVGMNVVHADQEVRQVGQTGPQVVQTTVRPYATGSRDTTADGTKTRQEIHSQLAAILKDEEDTNEKPPSFPETTSTASSPIPITTVSSLTTDQIFSHYKQPAKPIRGPMYLIIQGHSKVKTYKPTVENHGNGMEENEILDNTTARPVSKFERFVNENTKRMTEKKHVAMKKIEETNQADEGHSSRQDTLLSLLESGFSAFAMPPIGEFDEENSNSTTN